MNHKNMKLDEVAKVAVKVDDRVKEYVEPLLRELETKVGQLVEDIRVLKELVLPKPDPETIGYGGDS